MNILTRLLNLGKYKVTPLTKLLAGMSWGSMLFSFLFKKKAARNIAMKNFASQGLGILAIWGVAQLRDQFSSPKEQQQEPIKTLMDEKSTCKSWIHKMLGRCK